MNKRISSGNQTFDRIKLAINMAVIIILIIICLYIPEVFYLLLIVAAVISLNVINTISKYYISYADGYLIIDHVFKKRQIREVNLYKRITQNPFAVPFSNIMIIHLKTNEKFRFQGGLKGIQGVDLAIRNLMRE
jgi:hypothetical protein